MRLSSDLGSFLVLSSNCFVCKVHVKSVTSVAVQITSLSPCVGSFTRILTRHPFTTVNSVFSWNSGVLLSNDSILKINFWYNNVDSLNVEFIRGYNRYRVSFSDASDLACGAFFESASGLVCFFFCLFVCLFLFFHQNWSPEKKEKSSTCREPKVVCLALEAFAGLLSSARFIWYSDNQNVESALLNGSRKLDLQISFHPMFGTLRF